MVVRQCWSLKRNRMHRNAMRPSASLAVMATKPPKPPCWRDFMPDTRVPSQSVSDSEFTDISKVARNSTDSFSSDGVANNKSGKQKRIRAKLHRTRSQFTIEESDLPEEALTVTLAESKPDDLGLCRQSAVFDERVFQEDNNRKCQTWLQNIEACKPLEDIARYDISEPEVESVSIEVPDDTCWYDQSVMGSAGPGRGWYSESGPEALTDATQSQVPPSKPLHRTRTVDNKKGNCVSSKGIKGNINTFTAIFHHSDSNTNTG